MHETFYFLGNLDYATKIEHPCYRPLDDGANGEATVDVQPRVGVQLLDAEGETLVIDIDIEDLGFDFLTLTIEIEGVDRTSRPGQVGNVDEAVYSVFDTDKNTEVRDVSNLGSDDRAFRVALIQPLPRILFDLLHAEGHATVLVVDLEDNSFHNIALGNHLARVFYPLQPRHLGHVYQAFHPFFEFDKRAVLGEAHDLARNPLLRGVSFRNIVPGVLSNLLQTEGDTLVFRIKLEDFDLHFIADPEQLRGVVHPTPGHVGDVEQPVNSTEVHKTTVVGDILDDSVHHAAFLDPFQRLRLQLLAFFFEESTPRQNDVATLLVELDNLEFVALADELLEVAHGSEFHLGPGEECLHADVDCKTSLDSAGDDTFDQLASFGGLVDLIPDSQFVGLVFGELDQTVLILERVDVDADHGTFCDVDFAFGSDELINGDSSFGLVPNVHHDEILGHHDDGAFDNFALFHQLCAFMLGEQSSKLVVHEVVVVEIVLSHSEVYSS